MDDNPNASIHLCLKCDLWMIAFVKFHETASEVQLRYSEFVKNLDDIIEEDEVLIDLTVHSENDEIEIEQMQRADLKDDDCQVLENTDFNSITLTSFDDYSLQNNATTSALQLSHLR